MSPSRSLWFCAAFLVLAIRAPAADAAVNVVATVPDLGALAREVGGAGVSVTVLSLPTQDPHFVDAKPSLALVLNKADLLISIGVSLEVGWLPTLVTGARNAKIQPGGAGYLDCSTLVRLLDVPKAAIDRSMGDIHPGGNPHYLYDPRNADLVARGIAARLAQLDPSNAQTYARNYKAFADRLAAASAGWEKRLAGLRGTPVVTYHKSWVYFCAWLGLEEIAFLEPKPGIPPSPAHVARVLVLARQKGVKLVLQERYFPDDTSKLIAAKIPAPLVKIPAATDFNGGQSYLDHVEQVVKLVEAAR